MQTHFLVDEKNKDFKNPYQYQVNEQAAECLGRGGIQGGEIENTA